MKDPAKRALEALKPIRFADAEQALAAIAAATRAIEEAIREEREECAQAADVWKRVRSTAKTAASSIAEAIRARGGL